MNCRLYLVSPSIIDHPSIFAAEFRAALDGGDVAAFLLSLVTSDESAIARVADTLRPICQHRDVAFLLDGRPGLAAKLDCDGVQVAAGELAAARGVIGGRQVGVLCPASRHIAMEAAEAGADYVAFDKIEREMIHWWGELFEIPCVATGDMTLADAAALAASAADFVAVGEAVWRHADGAEAAVRAFNEALSKSSSTHR